MIRAALYARTSRAGQHIDAQLGQLRAVASQRGWQEVGEFVDDEISSRRVHRPAFEKLLSAAHSGQVGVVAAVALDRFARSVRELLDLSEKLAAWGVNLVSLREAVDTTSAVGKMTFTVLGAVAEFERELLRERTLAGLEAARARGKILGRPRADVDGDRVIELRQRGLSWSKVARRLGTSVSTAKRSARRRVAERQRVKNLPRPEAEKPPIEEVTNGP